MTLEEKQIEEAKWRMQQLGFVDGYERFNEKCVRLYGWVAPMGISVTVNYVINKFVKEHNALVYYAMHDHTEIGELVTLLYVSQYENDWAQDREDLMMVSRRAGHKYYQVCAYVENLDNPECSEIGNVGIIQIIDGHQMPYPILQRVE